MAGSQYADAAALGLPEGGPQYADASALGLPAGGPDEGPGVGESALRGAAQGASLGFADELTGAGEAALDRLTGAHADLVSLYKQHRDESRAKYKAAQEANPLAYGAAEVAGGVAPMLIPGVGGATAAARVAGAAGLGAAAGLGHSEAEDARGLVQDAAVSGLVGGAAGAAGEALSASFGRLLNRAAPKIQEAADVATAGSVGIPKAQIAGMKASGELGDVVGGLRDEGVATALTTPGQASARLAGRIDELNAGRIATLKGLDEKVASGSVPVPEAGSLISGNSLADSLDAQLVKLRQDPVRNAAQETFLEKGAAQFRELGDSPISFDQAEQYVRRYGGQKVGPEVKAVRNEAGKALREQLLQRASNVDIGAGQALDDAGRAVGALRDVEKMVRPAAEQGIGIPHSAVDLAFRVGKPFAQSAKGSAFNQLAQIARTSPQALGKWGGYLAQAAARGDAALATAHYALSQTDPSYAAQARAALDGGNGE